MHVKARLTSYDKLPFSVTLVAPVSEWRELLEVIDREMKSHLRPWPLSGFTGCIEKMLVDLDKTHADSLLKEDQLNHDAPAD